MSEAGLWADFSVTRGSFAMQLQLALAAGESLAVLGPNGAGKSTVLAVLAGLLVPDAGEVSSHGRPLTRRGRPGPDVQVLPEHRRIGLMGQDPLLFPHLSAMQNVAFGPRAQRRPRSTAHRQARDWLARLGLADYADRRPAQLSGGQRQRVALARALAAEPDVVLLDEPLGALDVETAPEIRQTLRTHLRDRGVTTVLVTHDVVDAAVLTDRALVIQDGRVAESGPTPALLDAPSSAFGAALAGLNLTEGLVVQARPHSGAMNLVTLRISENALITGVTDEMPPPGTKVRALFAPAAATVHGSKQAGLPATDPDSTNKWAARISGLQAGPSLVRLQLDRPFPAAVDVTPAAVADQDLRPGRSVLVSVPADRIRVRGSAATDARPAPALGTWTA